MDQESLSSLYQILPGLVSVSYSVRTGETWDAAVTVESAEKRNPTYQDIVDSQQRSPSSVLVWHLWRAELGGIVPKQGDRLTYSGVLWLVNTVGEELLGNRFRLTCIKGQ